MSPPCRFPSSATMQRDACFLNLLYVSFWALSKGAPPPGSPHRAPIERAPIPKPSIYLESPQETQPPPGSPVGPLWRELSTSRAFFYVSPRFRSKSTPDRKNLTLLLKSLGKENACHIPHNGYPMEKTTVSRALLNISFKIPSKGVLPPSSPHRAHRETH